MSVGAERRDLGPASRPRWVRKDGVPIDVEVSGAARDPRDGGSGSVVSHMALFADITAPAPAGRGDPRFRARIVRRVTRRAVSLERNLHDGAQQRLVALSLSLRLAQAKVELGSGDRGAECSSRLARSSPPP